MKNRVAVMHGVNLDMLERRPTEVYGDLSLPKLERQITQFAHPLGLETRFFQSNFEGEYVAGAAEWLKNSLDHAIRAGGTEEPVILFHISTPRGTKASSGRCS